ncbi:MAG TPA: 23S rRNA (pseudouridine(1915)-N(3))-methyltransferase RlmH [Candidatus Saccharimonadales bacterium]|jgi:23S rRNA (pseudouridine1915-N3)-methyltransferase|nr:23S rRNA (pseudouridine(1915)-N(3))-methyltransferase RlmH [Candidatus Saccharimonadales bacterium]
MPIRILSIGKKHESWVLEGIERYEKRLKKPFVCEWVFLPHSAREGVAARQEESERILSRLTSNEHVILLDERGKMLDSPGLSQDLLTHLQSSRNVTIIIGGAYGVDATVHQRADVVWSLSDLVFPHQLVRLILTEQLYRAQEIAAGNPYHHV